MANLMEAEGQNLEEIKHLPAEQNHCDCDGADGHHLAERHAVLPIGIDAARHQAENIDGGKAEYQRPENVVDVALLGSFQQGKKTEQCPGRDRQAPGKVGDGASVTGEMTDQTG